MISPFEYAMIIAAVLVLLMVLKIQQKRELANVLANQFCRQNGIQLLDGTVAFRGLHLNRPGLTPVFRFQFSYSTHRTDRYQGSISLVGRNVQSLYIQPEHLENLRNARNSNPLT